MVVPQKKYTSRQCPYYFLIHDCRTQVHFWMKNNGQEFKKNGHICFFIVKKVRSLSRTETTSYAYQPIYRKDGWTLTNKSSITSWPWQYLFRWRPSSPRHLWHSYKRKPCSHRTASWIWRTNVVGVHAESDTQVSNGYSSDWLIRFLQFHLVSHILFLIILHHWERNNFG